MDIRQCQRILAIVGNILTPLLLDARFDFLAELF
jgi:hypothetical protein